MIVTQPWRYARVSCLVLPVFLSGCGGGGGGDAEPAVTGPDVTAVGCLQDDGLDLFAAEADQALGLSWNNQGRFDSSGGYRIRYGTAAENYPNEVAVGCTALDCETGLTLLDNDITYYVVVDSINADNQSSGTSCEVSATPHKLNFDSDLQISAADTAQSNPAIASGWDGRPLFIGWVESGRVLISRSDDHGASWSSPVSLLDTGLLESNPDFSFRRRLVETDPDSGQLTVVVQPALFVTFEASGQVKMIRGDFPDGPTGEVQFAPAVDLGSGNLPSISVYENHVEVVYENDSGIWAASSMDAGDSFTSAQRVDYTQGAKQYSARPDVAIDPSNHDVFVIYHGQRKAGNSDIYLNYSRDSGLTYQADEVRVDDDTLGANQSNVSISVDARTGHVMATWEDRRQGSDAYFSRSLDGGVTWEANLNSGTGLFGDQFTPVAEADPGRNIYVLFIDTSAGHRPLFTRFNALGSFDVPVEVSASAGQAGATASSPVLTIDNLGSVYAAWVENRNGQARNVFFARAE